MTTATTTQPLSVVDHAEVVGTYVARNFFSLFFLTSMMAAACWARTRSLAAGAPDDALLGPIAVFALMLLLPVAAAAKPVARAYRPTAADAVVRWCGTTPVGASPGALWIGPQALRVIGSGYDERIPFTDIAHVEARVSGPSSWGARLLAQTQPLVVTKADGTEVSLIVLAPTSIARTIRRARAVSP